MYKNDKVIRRYSEPFKLKILDELTTGKLNKKLRMRIKRKIIWFYLLLGVIILNYSCWNSDYKTDNSVSEIDKTETKVDTNLWLKETRGIRDILEDSQGNFWFSSPDYIARFDGKKIQYFSKNEGLSIVGNLHEDQEGTIWIEDGFKVFRYEGKKFIQEKLNNNSNPNGSEKNQKNALFYKNRVSKKK